MPMLLLLAGLPLLAGCAESSAEAWPSAPVQQAESARQAFLAARESGEAVAAEQAARAWLSDSEGEDSPEGVERAVARAALAWALASMEERKEDALIEARRASEEAHALPPLAPALACELLFDAWLALGDLAQCETWAAQSARHPRDSVGWDPAYPFAVLGYAHWSAEDAASSDRCYARARALLAGDSDPGFAASVRLEYANTRLELGDYHTALSLFELVEQDPAARADEGITAQRKMRHGAVLADLGRFEAAESLLLEALASSQAAGREELSARILVHGVENATRGRDSAALTHWMQQLSAASFDDWDAWALKTVLSAESRMALLAGDAAGAGRLAEEAIAAIGVDDPREYLLAPWLARARADLARGEFARVASALRDASAQLDTAEVRARGSARVHLRSRYADWLQLAADLGWERVRAATAAERSAVIAEAWEEVDRWKARTLAESFSESAPPAAELAAGTVLIDYVGGGERLYAFRRVGASEQVLDLGAHGPVAALLSEYHRQLSDPDASTPLAELVATGHALYQALLQPVLPPDATRLLIVPEADWPGTPFAAFITRLPPEQEELRSFSQLEFAIEALSFAYAPSRAVGLHLGARDAVEGGGQALVFADPRCEDGRWPPLPGTRTEAMAVIAAVGGKLLLGEDATKAALLAALSDSGIVHLATHAIADPVAPERSRVVCSGPGEESDLSLRELQEHRLTAAVVVLSACETAGGRALRGEGAQSLATGFLGAGAQSVIATLWPVFDEDAAAMMSHFYAAGGGTRARAEDALRAAQLAMLRGLPETVASAESGPPLRGRIEGGRPLAPAHGTAAPLAGHPMRWASFLLYGPIPAHR